ncbi:PTS sugar transporter subunit IIA [Aerococcaceae bacterium WGS1372]
MDYLNKKFITKTSRKLNWKEAIELSARPLLDMKYISTSYINRLKELIANTEHMYLGNSVAIPHAETEDNVFFDGISILISETPVSFPNNDKVHLVVTLAIKDNTKHLNAMTQLLNLSNNDEEIEKILNMSESQVYDFIEKIEK